MAGSIRDNLAAASEIIAASETVAAVRDALRVFNSTRAGESFWPGGGDELLEALMDGGWRLHRFDAPYYWVAKLDGDFLAYTEGDINFDDNPNCAREVTP